MISNSIEKINFGILWLFIFTIPWQKSLFIPGVGSVNKLLGIILIVFYVLKILVEKKIKKPPRIFIIVYIYLLLGWLSWFWSQDPSGTLSKNILILQLVFLTWLIYDLCTSMKDVVSLLKANLLGCLVLSINSIYHFFTGVFSQYESRFDLEGLNPNDVGYLLALAIPIAWYLSMKYSKLYLLYIPIACWAILLTASRTAFIVTMFILILIGIYLLVMNVKYKKTIIFLILIMCIFVFQQVPKSSLDRISTIGNEVQSGTLNERTIIWQAGLEAFAQSPYLGVGTGAYGASTIQKTGLGEEMNAHNVFISILVEYGIIGFGLFIIIIISPFYIALSLKSYPSEKWLILCFILSWIIISTAKHTDAQKYTWEMFGFIWTIFSLIKAKHRQNIPLLSFRYLP